MVPKDISFILEHPPSKNRQKSKSTYLSKNPVLLFPSNPTIQGSQRKRSRSTDPSEVFTVCFTFTPRPHPALCLFLDSCYHINNSTENQPVIRSLKTSLKKKKNKSSCCFNLLISPIYNNLSLICHP